MHGRAAAAPDKAIRQELQHVPLGVIALILRLPTATAGLGCPRAQGRLADSGVAPLAVPPRPEARVEVVTGGSPSTRPTRGVIVIEAVLAAIALQEAPSVAAIGEEGVSTTEAAKEAVGVKGYATNR